MAIKSTNDSYGWMAIAFHWITAVMIVIMIALGINLDNAPDDATRRALLSPHIGLGITVLLLTLGRIAWWLFADKRPAPLPGIPAVMKAASAATHLLLYGFIIALAGTGIATNVMGGVIDALTSGAPIPSLDHLGPRQAHGLLAWSFMALLALHVAAALYHQFVRRDGTLTRMLTGKAR